MSFFQFFKPKWQHSDPRVRLAAVRELSPDSLEILTTVIREDSELAVCQAALVLLADGQTLTALVQAGVRPELMAAVRAKLFALEKQAVLTAGSLAAQQAALARCTDPRELMAIAAEGGTPLRLACIELIDSQEVLGELLALSWGKEPALAAVAKLDDPALLARAMKTASNKTARRLAEEKLKALAKVLNPPDPALALGESLQELVRAAAAALAEKYPPAGKEAMVALAQAWVTLDPTACHPLYQEFARLRQQIEERCTLYAEQHAEQVRDSHQRAEQVARCEASCEAIETLLTALGAEADSGFQAAEQQWQQASTNLAGVLPVELQSRFTELCRKFEASRQTIAGEIEHRDLLAEQLAKLSGAPKAQELESRLASLVILEKKLLSRRFQFLSVAELREKMAALRGEWQELHQQELAGRDLRRRENLAQHQQLLLELESLLTAPDRSAAESRVKELKNSWVAMSSLSAEDGALKQSYKALLDQFAQSQQQFHQEQSWLQWSNQTKKEELIRQVEALAQEEDPRTVFRVLKEAQSQWRQIGPVPAKVSEKIWTKFRAVCDRNFLRCKEYFVELERGAEGNRQRKVELLRQAEGHQGSTAWQTSAEVLKQLQAEWKEIGSAGKSEENKLSRQFNAVCDLFFAARKAHLAELDIARQANLQQKERLCQEAEQLVALPLPGLESKFQELQAAWKKIGPVPKEVSEELWQRFRGAGDRYFQWLDEQKPSNLAEKERLCQELESLVGGVESDTNLKLLAKEILVRQTQWQEIGPVPKEVSEALWQRFRGACDTFFNLQRQQFMAREAHRQGNEETKLGLIHELEQAIGNTDRESASRVQELQLAWQSVGPATKEQERQLQQRFKEAADHFFNDRRATFVAQDTQRQENLKKKERLCVRLEVISKHPQANTALNLAEQLKLAMESNFMLAGQDPEQRRKLEGEEIALIKQEWQLIGPVPHAHEQKLHRRFQAALAGSTTPRELKGKAVPAASKREKQEELTARVG